MKEYTPSQIVKELDKYIIGQTENEKKRCHSSAQQISQKKAQR